MTKLFKRLHVLMLIGLLVIVNCFTVKADCERFGVSPSIIQKKCEKGKRYIVPIKVGNTSQYSKALTDGESKYTEDIDITVDSEGNNSNKADVTKWVKLDKNYMKLKPNQVEELRVALNVPDNVHDGEYKIGLLFTKRSKKVSSGVDNISSIKIPLIIVIGYENLNVKYDIGNLNVKVNEYDLHTSERTQRKEKLNDIWSAVFSTFTFNKVKILNAFSDIKYKPYLNKKGNTIYFDFNQKSRSPLMDMVTRTKVTNSKYIKIPKDIDLNGKLNKISFNTGNIQLCVDGKQFEVEIEQDLIEDIKEQTNATLGLLGDNPKLSDWLHKVKCYRNKKYKVTNVYVTAPVTNKGDISFIADGLVGLYKDNKNFDTGKYEPTLVKVGDTKHIACAFPYDQKFIEGEYDISSVIGINGKNPTTRYAKFKLTDIRSRIFMWAVLLTILIWVLIIIIVYIIYKLLKERKYNEKECTEIYRLIRVENKRRQINE